MNAQTIHQNPTSPVIEISQGNISGSELETATVPKTITEFCPHCECAVTLPNAFIPQACPECLNLILPCSSCNHQECRLCPLKPLQKALETARVRRGTADDYHQRVFGQNTRLYRLLKKLTPVADETAKEFNPPKIKTDAVYDVLVRVIKRLDYDTRISREIYEALINLMREAGTHSLSDGEGNYYTLGTMDGAMGVYKVQPEKLPAVIRELKKFKMI
ncbi:MAG TPA: hypothetical protein VK308_14560 [Pyrinomonadaceae bacterium]|nr:hypothetical protein [Pyrinomonadaceae bacterium]